MIRVKKETATFNNIKITTFSNYDQKRYKAGLINKQ